MLQTIPADPEYSIELHKLTLQGNTDVDWVRKHQPSINIWNSRLEYIFEPELINQGIVPDYDDWYLNRTRRFLTRIGAFHSYLVSVVVVVYFLISTLSVVA